MMFLGFLFLTYSVYGVYIDPITSYLPESKTEFFTQILNHFDPLDTRKFQQKYYVNDKYWKDKNAPVMLQIAGEMPCSGISETLGEFAQSIGALLITLEHRYYGQSCPFDPNHLKTTDIRYLSSKQALEDVANFKQFYQTEYCGVDNKWIAVGTSYSGALSAWSRYKYPHLFCGSWSSSGSVDTHFEFPEFDGVVYQSAESTKKTCGDILRNATLFVEKLVDNPSTRNDTLKRFDPDAVKMKDGDFYYMLADMTVFPFQYMHPEEMCDIMTSNSNGNNLLDRFVKAYNEVCVKYFNFSPAMYSIETFKSLTNNAGRLWWFQKCTEVGYFQVAPEKNSIRSKHVNLQYHLDTCKEAFGIDNPKDLVEAMKIHYGRTEIVHQTTNIFFANGIQDPWQASGVLPQSGNNDMVEDEVQLIHCSNCGHCCDVRDCPGGCKPDTEHEKAKESVKKLIKEWTDVL